MKGWSEEEMKAGHITLQQKSKRRERGWNAHIKEKQEREREGKGA